MRNPFKIADKTLKNNSPLKIAKHFLKGILKVFEEI
jgi:hypothetical protein